MAETATAGRRPPPRRWLAFFAILALLSGVAVLLPIVYNRQQQLRPEQLVQARQRWQAVAPADYDLSFSVRVGRDPLPERHVVLVRGGRVVFAACEGELLHLAAPLSALVGLPAAAPRGVAVAVPGLFDRLETLLAERDASGRADFLIASFDPHAGYPRRFTRRVPRTAVREEWKARVWPPGELQTFARR